MLGGMSNGFLILRTRRSMMLSDCSTKSVVIEGDYGHRGQTNIEIRVRAIDTGS